MICRSWASQDVARAVDWPCPAQYYEYGRVFDTVFIMHELESQPEFFFLFVREIRLTQRSANIHKSDDNISEKIK